MANEYAVTNQQNEISLLGANTTGTETRRLQVTDDGRLKVDANLSVEGDVNIGNVGLMNTSEVEINPATEDKQNSILAELQTLNSLVPSVYDYISMSYTDGNLTGVVFKTGGSGGTTVSTLTLAYTDGNLTSITKT